MESHVTRNTCWSSNSRTRGTVCNDWRAEGAVGVCARVISSNAGSTFGSIAVELLTIDASVDLRRTELTSWPISSNIARETTQASGWPPSVLLTSITVWYKRGALCASMVISCVVCGGTWSTLSSSKSILKAGNTVRNVGRAEGTSWGGGEIVSAGAIATSRSGSHHWTGGALSFNSRALDAALTAAEVETRNTWES